MGILNKAQVDMLFHNEAVLIGSVDGVPDFRVSALFGEDATKHAKALFGGRHLNGYDIGDYTLMCLTYQGFQAAASFYNVQKLREVAAG